MSDEQVISDLIERLTVRAERAEADLAELRAGVEALAERWEGAYNSGCITGDYSHDMATASTYRECEHSLRALLDTATEETGTL